MTQISTLHSQIMKFQSLVSFSAPPSETLFHNDTSKFSTLKFQLISIICCSALTSFHRLDTFTFLLPSHPFFVIQLADTTKELWWHEDVHCKGLLEQLMKNIQIQITDCSDTLASDLHKNEIGHHPWMSSVDGDVTVMFAIMQWKKHFLLCSILADQLTMFIAMS